MSGGGGEVDGKTSTKKPVDSATRVMAFFW